MHEERRLFYVACTRARKQLYITYSDTYEGAKKWKASPFLSEIKTESLYSVFDHTTEVADISTKKIASKKSQSTMQN